MLHPIVGLVFGLGGAPEARVDIPDFLPSNHMKDLHYDRCGLPAGVYASSD